jgi:hypothetical protein
MIVALAYLLLSSTAFAQAQPAVLTGVVSDQNGVSLMDSRVVLYLDDGRVLESEIGSEGTFSFEIEGSFEIEIAHPGYRSVRTTPATLSSGATYEIQVVLLEGDSADFETVELLLDDPVTLTGALGPTLREDLPRSDRLFGLRGGINVSGIAEGSSQQWIAAAGNVFASSPSAATLIESFDFSAAFVPYAGVDDSLPPGRSRFNGDLYYFHRNDGLNARNYFDRPDERVPPFKYHFFGAEAGGALGDETFGFVRYWGLRARQSVTRAATVPDPVQVDGDFSGISELIVDPETGFPFPGNRIPPDRIHPEGRTLAGLYPAPNVLGQTIKNYRGVALLETVADAIGVRIDHRMTVSDESAFEYQFSRDTTQDPFNLVTGLTNLPGFGVRDALSTHTFRASNTHVFSAALLHRMDFSIGHLGQPREILSAVATPAVIIPGLSSVGHATNLPQHRRNRSIGISSDVSWFHGGATTTIGGSFSHFRFDAFMDLLSRGQFQFNDGSFSGNALANLLLGIPATAMRIVGDTRRRFTTSTEGVFVQHEWDLRPNLQLSGGLRYDYQQPFRESSGLVSGFRLDGVLETSPDTLYEPDRNNWAPRVGVAWSPLSDTVIRAGYGVFFDNLSVGDSLFMLGLNPPFVQFDVETNDPVVPRFDLTTVFDGSTGSVPPSIFSASQRLVNPYIQQWSLLAGRSISSGFDVTVSYTGQKGTHLRRQTNLNQPTAGDALTLEDRRPFGEYRNIFQFETSASSSGHALDIGLVRRGNVGPSFRADYRFARSIDDATLISILPQNSHDLSGERGLSDFHVKHRFTLNGTYDLPFALPFVSDGGRWQVQVAAVLASGSPVSAILGTDVAGTGSPILNRPNLVGDPKISNPGPSRFFNTEAFEVPEFGQFGNSGRNVIPGPGLANFDIALLRDFRLSEQLAAELRVDFYNAFNHPNFVAPPTMQNFADSPDFGALFVARSPRIVQMGIQIFW